MNTTKYLIATLAGLVVMFLLGGLGHELILPAITGPDPLASVMLEEPSMIGIAVGYLVLALIMAYMYPKGVEGTSKAGNGLKFGVLIGLLFSLPISIIFYSVYEGVTISMIIAEAIWHSIEQGLGGLAIAYGYGASVFEQN